MNLSQRLTQIDEKEVTVMAKDIEFNNGFITALALFYHHRGQFKEAEDVIQRDMSIYAGSDHLFDLEYPTNIPEELKNKIEDFRRRVLEVRMADISKQHAYRLYEECKELLIEIDEKVFGLKVVVNYS
jgi:hypothetical protein